MRPPERGGGGRAHDRPAHSSNPLAGDGSERSLDLPFAERLAIARADLTEAADLRAAAPVGLQDQADAASRETGRYVTEAVARCRVLEPDRGWQSSAVIGRERVASLYAAVLGCRPCIHLRRNGQPQPGFADLAHRLLSCRRCARTWRRPVDDARCEVCSEPAGPTFTPFLLHLGYVAVGGNAGDCCAHLVTGEVAA